MSWIPDYSTHKSSYDCFVPRAVKLPWIFPGAQLFFNAAPVNIQVNLNKCAFHYIPDVSVPGSHNSLVFVSYANGQRTLYQYNMYTIPAEPFSSDRIYGYSAYFIRSFTEMRKYYGERPFCRILHVKQNNSTPFVMISNIFCSSHTILENDRTYFFKHGQIASLEYSLIHVFNPAGINLCVMNIMSKCGTVY